VRIAGLLGANALILMTGLGLLPLLGVARSWRTLVARCGLGYLCGIVLAGIVAANLALVRVSFGWIGLSVLAVVSVVAGAWRLRGTERPSWRRPSWIALAGVAALAAVLAEYARAFAVAPLNRYDAWAIWALKGHALYAFGWANPAVFAGHEYRFANLDYPLLLPSLEAIDFRAMGAFDTRLLHLQFLLVLVAGLMGLAALLRDRVPALLLWPSLVAVTLAPAVFDQLLTAYADVPLALVFAVGIAAAGRWLVTNERWALVVAVLCFAGALLTKNEGSLFVAAAFLGLVLAAHGRRRVLVLAAAVDILLLLPWRIYVWIYGLHDLNYKLADSFNVHHISGRLGVGPIAFRTLAREMVDPLQWGLLLPLFAVLVIAAWAAGLRALPLYALVWTIVSWLGLSWIYVISHFEYSLYLDQTKERVIASIVLGGAALTPLLAAEAWASRCGSTARGRPPTGAGRTP
jgi:hypothetical protein